MAKKKPETKAAPAPKAAAAAAPKAAAAAAPKAAAAAPKAAAAAPKAAAPVAPAPAPTPVVATAPVVAGHDAAQAPEVTAHGFRRKLVGRVTSNKMSKTVVVEVIRKSADPVYKKYVKARERYKAHDETNQYKVGDRVEIQEHRPISREKRWLVTKLISRAVQE
jgi:small subunit ribosomal protein S17